MTELDLFAAAIGTPDPAARAALLDRECAGDPALRERLDKLLAAHFAANPLLDPFADATGAYGDHGVTRTGVGGAEPTGDYPGKDVHAGAVIAGKYTLVEAIGEGGMGSVWRAKQTEPVKRFVAVKLVKAGMDSKQVLARFEAERQALALMDHPNIAKVLDGGIHDGRPFFVMELVKGTPITTFCDANRLTPKQRLELFVQACQAIQHAHQKGVIHRDIKPSNVLVALYDDRPVVKVIDFGVAKATGGTLTEKTLDTGFGGVVGTPTYMSPEQATFNNLDIDTRSDVYALGVLLYELLTGTPPFSARELQQKGLLEILRVVREEEPPRPSTKLSTSDALPSLSANRGTEPKKLTGLLRNELDWIVMKALEKDRARRYDTANGFAADVLRYLSGEAVLAHPPSRGYRVRKFVRRNRPQVVAASLVLLALVAGVIGTTWQAVRTERARADEAEQRGIAETNENLARERLAQVEAEKKRADAEKRIAQAVKDFLQKKLLAQADPSAQVDPLRGGGAVAAKAKFNPTIRELLDRAADELDEAKIDSAFPDQPLLQAELLQTVGAVYQEIGEYETAARLMRRSVALFAAHGQDSHPDALRAAGALALADAKAGKLDDAVRAFEAVLSRQEATLGVDHRDALETRHNLATVYWKARQYDTAIARFEGLLAVERTKLGPDDPATLATMNSLGAVYAEAGKPALAWSTGEQALTLARGRFGADHPKVLPMTGNLAARYWAAKQLDKSIPLFEEVVRLLEKYNGRDHPDTLNAVANLGVNYKDAGRLADAIPLLEEANRAVPKYPLNGWVCAQLFDAYFKAQDRTNMAKVLRDRWPQIHDNLQPLAKQDPVLMSGVYSNFGSILLDQREWAAAERPLREALAIREKPQPDAWTTFNTQSMLGGALLGQKKYADAEPPLLKGYEGLKAREKLIPPIAGTRIPEALDRLIELYTATKKPDEAKKYRELRAKYPPELAPRPRAAK